MQQEIIVDLNFCGSHPEENCSVNYQGKVLFHNDSFLIFLPT
jgi:hypothetical protein